MDTGFPICVVFNWRCNKTGQIWQSEIYARNIKEARNGFYKRLDRKGRVLYAKTHTGTKYDNRGRFC